MLLCSKYVEGEKLVDYTRRAVHGVLIGVALGGAAGSATWNSTHADDTDIYVDRPPAAQPPNVLFIMDTSSSMGLSLLSGQQERIEAVQQALTGLIRESDGFKAGLGRFHSDLGGSILFPVVDLDSAPLFLTESASVSGIDRSSDDAEEYNGELSLEDGQLELTKFNSHSEASITTEEMMPANYNDTANGFGPLVDTGAAFLELGHFDVGIRFPGFRIPRHALILHAEVEFWSSPDVHTGDTDVMIHAERGADSLPFAQGGASSVAGRVRTDIGMPWSNLTSVGSGAPFTTPNIREVIQELVNSDDWPQYGDDQAPGESTITLLFEPLRGLRKVHAFGHRLPRLRIKYLPQGTVIRRKTERTFDAEQRGQITDTKDTGLGLMQDDGGSNDAVGLIFRPDVPLPKEAVAVWADVRFIASPESADTPSGLGMAIHGIQQGDPGSFEDQDILSRPLTDGMAKEPSSGTPSDGVVEWLRGYRAGDEEMFSPHSGDPVFTPNIAELINEMADVIENPGRGPGNPLGLIFKSASSDDSGVARLGVCSSDGVAAADGCPEDEASQPTLNVFYAMPGAIDQSHSVGLRFNNVNVPQGARIESAHIEFTVDGITPETGPLTIDIEDSIEPSTFSDAPGGRISDREYIGNEVWNPGVWSTIGAIEQTDDISDLIEEVTERREWCGGGSMSFRITGSGARLLAEAFDKGANGAPKLRIGFDARSLQAGEGCITRQASFSVDDQHDVTEDVDSGQIDPFAPGGLSIGTRHLVGLRFNGVEVPRGARILGAHLRLTADADRSGEATITIKAEQHPNPPPFNNFKDFTLSDRGFGERSVKWSESTPWTNGETYSTEDDGADLTPLIQDIVNGNVQVNAQQWSAGNAMVFSLAGSSNERIARDCNLLDCRFAALLFLRYQVSLGDLDDLRGAGITARQGLASTVNGLPTVGLTPLVDALYEASQYFAGETVHFGRTRGAGKTFEETGVTSDVDLDSGLFGALDFELGAPENQLSVPSTYMPPEADIVRDEDCTTASPNSGACWSEHIGNDEHVVYVSPLDTEGSCEKGFLVLLSDGAGNRNSSRQLIRSYTGDTSCALNIPRIGSDGSAVINQGRFDMRSATKSEQCGLELVRHLYHTDFIRDGGERDVTNNVTTFTIGFDLGTASNTVGTLEFMKALAFVGQGGDLNDPDGVEGLSHGDGFFEASNADELLKVFETIVSDIHKDTTSFAAPGLSINAFNRLFNRDDIYFSLFRPGETVAWQGNLKKFKLCDGQPGCGFGEVIDPTGAPAVITDPTDFENFGNLKATAYGFWSGAADSAPEINQGGAGALIPTHTERNVFVEIDSAVLPEPDLDDAALAGTRLHKIDLNRDLKDDVERIEDYSLLQKALGPGDSDPDNGNPGAGNCMRDDIEEQTACLNDLIEWMAGKWFAGDARRDGTKQDTDRWAFGDPMHSQPLVLTYGRDDVGTPKDPDDDIPLSKIFVGTNDGGLRMINEGDGVEEWIFYPNAMLRVQETLKQNPAGEHEYGVDDTPTARIKDDDKDGIIEPEDGDFVHIYFGYRRGGREIIALNVTPDAPVRVADRRTLNAGTSDEFGISVGEKGKVVPEILWRISGLPRLGQTWSTPRPIRVAGEAGPRTVLVFGGGYDPHQQDGLDQDGIAPDGGDAYADDTNGDSSGGAIFIVDADTGERLWWASEPDGDGNAENDPDFELAAMNTGIVAPVTPLDTNNDGLVDRLYAVDLRGQVFRVDILFDAHADSDKGESIFGNSSVGLLARLGDAAENESRRKLFYAPEVARVNDTAIVEDKYELIGIVSGNRSNPRGKTVLDRAYGLRDFMIENPSGGLNESNYPRCNPLSTGCNAMLTDDDLTDVTSQDEFVIRARRDGTIAPEDAAGEALESADTRLVNLRTSHGWYFDLEGNNLGDEDVEEPSGEKGFSAVTVLDGKMFFTTFLPPPVTGEDTDVCSVPAILGTSRFYAIDFFTGAPAFDFDNDGTFEKTERFQGLGAGPSADVVPAYLPGGITLPVPTGAGAVAKDPDVNNVVEKTYWIEKR